VVLEEREEGKKILDTQEEKNLHQYHNEYLFHKTFFVKLRSILYKP